MSSSLHLRQQENHTCRCLARVCHPFPAPVPLGFEEDESRTLPAATTREGPGVPQGCRRSGSSWVQRSAPSWPFSSTVLRRSSSTQIPRVLRSRSLAPLIWREATWGRKRSSGREARSPAEAGPCVHVAGLCWAGGTTGLTRALAWALRQDQALPGRLTVQTEAMAPWMPGCSSKSCPEAQLCLGGGPWAGPVTRKSVAAQALGACLWEACAARGRRRDQAGREAHGGGRGGSQTHQ